MKICHVCGYECGDAAVMCENCGAELTFNDLLSDEDDTVKGEEVEELEDAVLVASVDDVVTAEIFKDVLKESGISFMSESSSGGMRVTFGGGFSAENVYVSANDLDDAKELYISVLESEEDLSLEDFEEI